ncbi:hypothetical protein OY671_012990, partial [Metschnikowia pulcherrima]
NGTSKQLIISGAAGRNFSPDGKQLAFTSSPNLGIANADGTGATIFSGVTSGNPSWGTTDLQSQTVTSTTTIIGRPELESTSLVPGMTIVAAGPATPNVSLASASATALGLQLVSDVFDIIPSTSFNPLASIVFRYDPAVVTDTT